MSESEAKHVFVSYVREDAGAVDGLCEVLDAAQIPFWRDRSALGPGDAWKAKIRQAIQEGSLVFLACFSERSRAREKSYMNEELTLAIDEFRKLPPGRTWLIPVRFDDGEVPDWDRGAGRVLRDINYLDLFGSDHMANAARLITTIHRLTGEKRPTAATALAAVEQAAGADRTDLVKRLTKEMLLDPTRRIEMDDLVAQEVQRIMKVLNDNERVAGPLTGSEEEKIVAVARQAQELWTLTQPFCASLQVAVQWGMADLLTPWANGLKAFLTTTTRAVGGVELLLALRHLPGMVGIMTATIASAASRNWGNLRSLVIDPTVPDQYNNLPVPLVEATSMRQPFGANEWVALTLARSTINNEGLSEALQHYTQRRTGKLFTPDAEWLHHVLRPMFANQIPDAGTYDLEFDRAEVMLGALAQDQATLHTGVDGQPSHPRQYWLGRATWRANRRSSTPVNEFLHELSTQGAMWGPLKGQLFGGDRSRAENALVAHGKNFEIATHQRF